MMTNLTLTAVRFEHLGDALGIGAAQPRLSWVVETAPDGWQQAGYALEAYGPDGNWSSKRVASNPISRCWWRGRLRRSLPASG